MKLKNIISIALASAALTLTGCDDFLSTGPTGSLSDTQVVTDVAGLQALLNGTYRQVRDGAGYGVNFYSQTGMKSLSTASGIDLMINDEQPFELYRFASFEMQRYEQTQTVPQNMWYALYKMISNANIILANVDNAAGDKTALDEIKGQALALRARCYFELVQFYQHTYMLAKNKPGVPLYLEPTTEPKARATVSEVYDSILNDLTTAETLLVNFKRTDKNYYNVDVVRFLLANVYLVMNEWEKAQSYANKVRTAYPLMTIEQYHDGFSTVNEEWVLGYTQGSQDYWWYDSPACWFDFGQNNAPWVTKWFLPVKHFVEVIMKDDPRLMVVENPSKEGFLAITKFRELKDAGPYSDLYDLRAAEMYLVEAECAVRRGDVSTALSVLNTLQKQRGATVTDTTNPDALLEAILLERRKEMWGEGVDLFDILRLQRPVKKTIEDGFFLNAEIPANSSKLIMMIPEKEIINNPLIEQNPHPDQQPVFVP